MCLLVVAWQSHPRYRLIVAGNRDEFHERPAAPLGWWHDSPGILAGRDLRAGGTWLGLSRSGRVGLVTNFRDADAATGDDAPSRGALVPDFLRASRSAESWLGELQGRASRYAGFNLLLGDATGLHYYANVGEVAPRALPPGIYGLSNHRLDEPWPKLVRTRTGFMAALRDDDPAPAALLELLGDATPAYQEPVPDRGLPADLERALSAPFVRHERYGTRCSTVVLVGQDGRTTVHERRFAPTGAPSGQSHVEFAGPAS